MKTFPEKNKETVEHKTDLGKRHENTKIGHNMKIVSLKKGRHRKKFNKMKQYAVHYGRRRDGFSLFEKKTMDPCFEAWF